MNNKGLSYLELLIAVVIMTVATSLTAVSISVVNRANSSKGIEQLQSSFNEARMESLSRGSDNGSLYLKAENGKILCLIGSSTDAISTKGEWNVLAKTPVEAALYNEGGEKEILGSTPVKFSFKQESGGFKDCPYTFIEFSASNTNVSTLRLYRLTGKSVIK